MYKFFRKRIGPLVLAVSVALSLFVVPAEAFDPYLLIDVDRYVGIAGGIDSFIDGVKAVFEGDKDSGPMLMSSYYFENQNNRYTVESKAVLDDLSYAFNNYFGNRAPFSLSVTTRSAHDGNYWVIEALYEKKNDKPRFYFTNGENQILCFPVDGLPEDDISSGRWVGYSTYVPQRMVSLSTLEKYLDMWVDSGVSCSINKFEAGYMLSRTTGTPPYISTEVFADSSGRIYVAPADDRVVNGDRVHIDGDGNEINVGIDFEGGTLNLPDVGELNINQTIYDDSTKTYYIDAWGTDKNGDTYVTYNYSFTYNIDYTSITYIGQTEEYNKYYKIYYELPDGRSSADLTVEELEQLNVSIDVLPYVRSTDDVHVRALYHFDGDTTDSSYWNHLSSFEWTTGASITYMDAGVFEGALYLDEQSHRFVITLPKNIASSDFTLQWRMYQSATPAPVSDTNIAVGGQLLLKSDGSHWLDNGGTQIASIPVGSWCEYAIVRSSSGLHFFVNGLKVYSWASALANASYTNQLIFNFGDQQQTYKYFDELRVVTKALYGTEGYTPTAVPHDTNLALVLPDSKLPVADAYWSFESSKTNLLKEYGLSDWVNVADGDKANLKAVTETTNGYFTSYYNSGNKSAARYLVQPFLGSAFEHPVNYPGRSFPLMQYSSNVTLFNSDFGSRFSVAAMNSTHSYISPNYSVVTARDSSNNFSTDHLMYQPTGGLITTFPLVTRDTADAVFPDALEAGKTYTLSMVDGEGQVGSFTFTMPELVESTYSGYSLKNLEILPSSLTPITESKYLSTVDVNGGTTTYQNWGYGEFAFVGEYLFNDYYFIVYPAAHEERYAGSNADEYYPRYVLQIVPVVSDETLNSSTGYYDGGEFVYLELVEGESDLKAEYVESIAVMDKDDINTPSLAVKTDIDITGHQIGGMRPSVPEKGLVWALVEGGIIKSLQIYNGSAWEAVDGRIWTGSRWVPYSAYNVLLMKDLYDITGTVTPDDYEYIYTESGFWSWLQKWLNDFKTALFGRLDQIIDGSGSDNAGEDSDEKCLHAYAIDFQSDPTCTDPGKTVYSCPLCGDTYTEYVDALDHDWVEQTHVDDSYHLPAGVTCPGCSGTNFLPTLADKEYSCTCNDCQTVWQEEARVDVGYTVYECSRCGEQRKEHNDSDSNLFEALGNFLADGVEWISDKLQQLVNSLSGISDIFTNMAETIKQYAGDFSGLFGEFLALMPADLMNVVWFGLVITIALVVWKKWFS